MKRCASFAMCCTALWLCGVMFAPSARAQQKPKEYINRQAPMEHWPGLLRLVETIPIPTEGYIDHLTYDLKNQHLFISGENNKTLVVVDMKAGKVIHETRLGGSLAVFHEDDPDHFRMLGKVPTGAIAKSGVWIAELKRYYSAVPKHLVQLLPTTQYGMGDWVTEESHLMVFEEVP